MVDVATKRQLSAIPLLKTKAGPRDKEQWPERLKEEVTSLIKVGFFFDITCTVLPSAVLDPVTEY